MAPDTFDEFESQVWARLAWNTQWDITVRREVAISEMFDALHPADASEVESLMLARLDEEQRNTILADRTHWIGIDIGERAGKMTPSDAQELEKMISAALERQDRDEVGEVACTHRYTSPWWRAVR